MKTFKEFVIEDDKTLDEAKYEFDMNMIQDLADILHSTKKKKLSKKELANAEELRKKAEAAMASIEF